MIDISPKIHIGASLLKNLIEQYIFFSVVTFNSSTNVNFADDTVMVGLISNNETPYIEEIKNLDINLVLNTT